MKRYNTPHRSRVVKTRLSEDEYADFTARLAPYGISQSEFLRQAIRRTTIRPVIHVSAVNDELLSAVGKLAAEYGRIGGNLNQIARYLNEYGAPYNALSGEVRAAIADLAALKYEVLQKVGDAVGKPPALYDLTTLQRDANRLLGFTAQQTLDYLQSLYEKKLCTYPRTDSRYLTSDMAAGLPELVRLTAGALPFAVGMELACNAAQVINDKKVTDHHAVIPTRNLQDSDLSGLPVDEKAVLELVALRLLCAVAQPYTFAETAVSVECAGAEFTAKGKTVKRPGWRALDAAYRAELKNAEPETEDKALPELTEGQTLPLSGAAVKEGKTTPPKHFTEDTLLSAMETAGKDDMPEDAERKGLGTPATRAGILEKLVATGFLERKKSKKTVQLLPSHDAVSLITVLPEQLQSPLLTAEWEYRLGEIERGELAPEDFMAGISAMLQELVGTYQVIKGTEYLFAPPREVVGKCPRCGGDVVELQKGFFCQNEGCKFAIWKNNKWWELKHKQPTKAIVTALLKDGRAHVSGLYSEKTGKTYDATVVLDDDGKYANFKLDFNQQKGGKR
nr:DNA topoisomerase [Flavonifractor sp. An306]